jgi:hypothetical protein
MNFFRLLPVILSLLLLAAHFLRAGQTVITLAFLLLVLLLFLKKSWIPLLTQVVLLLGAAEWLRTLYSVAQMRIEFGMPWTRMAIIPGPGHYRNDIQVQANLRWSSRFVAYNHGNG